MSPNRFPSKYERPENSPGFLLWQVTNTWQRKMRHALRDLRLTHVQFVLLTAVDWLNSAGLKTTQKAVSDFARTDIMMTSQVLRVLEKRRLLVRDGDPADSRAYILRLTSEGKALDKKALGLVEDTDREFFLMLRGDLGRFTENLRELARRTE